MEQPPFRDLAAVVCGEASTKKDVQNMAEVIACLLKYVENIEVAFAFVYTLQDRDRVRRGAQEVSREVIIEVVLSFTVDDVEATPLYLSGCPARPSTSASVTSSTMVSSSTPKPS